VERESTNTFSSTLSLKNDYSQHFVDTGERPQNFIRDADVNERFEEYTNNTKQHNTTQHNTTQHNTTQHTQQQHNTTQHNTTQHTQQQHNTTQHNTHTQQQQQHFLMKRIE
jgi:hypothetical protein